MTTMLAFSISEWHDQGGVPFMLPIELCLIINICLIGYFLFQIIMKKDISIKQLELLKHIGTFGLAFGAFGTLIGLMLAFDALEEAKGTIADYIIYGGLKVALIGVLTGFFTYLLSMFAYIIFKVLEKAKS